jgi:flagellar motor switch protein FliN/FliY
MADTETNAVEEETTEQVVTPEAALKNKINADVLQNIPVTISVEVGRTSLKIRDLMRLTQGSVVELDRLAGEPLDLLVNNTLVAPVDQRCTSSRSRQKLIKQAVIC